MSPQVAFRARQLGSHVTGALDIALGSRRVLSLPSQLGCAVACTFCVSRDAPLQRNLRPTEMLSLIEACLLARPPDGRPIELSFTGEGEPLANLRSTIEVVHLARARWSDIASVRYCLSGFAAGPLLDRFQGCPLPARLQVSLHSARQAVRQRLIPRSVPLQELERTVRSNAFKFQAVELNVVLQQGINDSQEDLDALGAWGDSQWPILLNPLLGVASSVVSPAAEWFAQMLSTKGRAVRQFSGVAAEITRQAVYPMLRSQSL